MKTPTTTITTKFPFDFFLLACMQGIRRHHGKVLAGTHQGSLLMQNPCCCMDGQGLSSLAVQAMLSVPRLMENKSGLNFLCYLHHSGEVVGGKLRWCCNNHRMLYQCKNKSSKKTRKNCDYEVFVSLKCVPIKTRWRMHSAEESPGEMFKTGIPGPTLRDFLSKVGSKILSCWSGVHT